MFRNAQGKFDGRVFIGVMMGLGSVSGMALKLWWSIGETVPPFWLWAIPLLFLLLGASVWTQRRRDQAHLRRRVERAARVVRGPDQAPVELGKDAP